MRTSSRADLQRSAHTRGRRPSANRIGAAAVCAIVGAVAGCAGDPVRPDARNSTTASAAARRVQGSAEQAVAGSWEQVPGWLTNVSVGNDGAVWGVSSTDGIWRWKGDGWEQVPGSLKQISAGSATRVWGVNSNDAIWRWTGAGWEQIPGSLKNVSVGADGAVWGVSSSDAVWRWTGSGWEQMPGSLEQISVGSATAVWGVSSTGAIWRWTGRGWDQVSGELKHVSVGADGTVWGVNAADEIYSRTPGGWERVAGALKQIAVGSAGRVWGVNSGDLIWRRVPPAATTVQVTPGQVTLLWGYQTRLSATPRDAAGNPTGDGVSWASLSPGVATVDGGGLVVGRELGTATVQARSGTMVGSASVTVSEVTLPRVLVCLGSVVPNGLVAVDNGLDLSGRCGPQRPYNAVLYADWRAAPLYAYFRVCWPQYFIPGQVPPLAVLRVQTEAGRCGGGANNVAVVYRSS